MMGLTSKRMVMKNLIFILFAFVLLSRCDSKDSAPKANAKLGNPLQIKASESIEMTQGVGNAYLFTVKVLSINDSRCPINATCIWAGEGKVEFNIVNDQFTLKIGELKVVEIGNESYTITLDDFSRIR